MLKINTNVFGSLFLIFTIGLRHLCTIFLWFLFLCFFQIIAFSLNYRNAFDYLERKGCNLFDRNWDLTFQFWFQLNICTLSYLKLSFRSVNSLFNLIADPFSMAPQKALESIGKTLSVQYERWQPRVETIMPRTLHDLLYC